MTYGSNFSIVPFCDRTTVGFSRVPHASKPDFDQYYPRTSIPCSLPYGAGARLKNERIKCDRNLGWSIDFATAFIVNHLDPATSPDAAIGLKKLRLNAHRFSNGGHSLELPYRMFAKLDELLFAGHLKGAVYLDQKSLGNEESGATFTHGRGPNRRVQRISIILNSIILQQASSAQIVANLIHHMIHAYFLVACGPQCEKETEYGRLSHGLHFGKVAKTIKTLSGVRGKPLPLGFSHYLPTPSYYDEFHPRPLKQYAAKWYRSHCHPDVPCIPDADLEEFYDIACAPLLDQPESAQKSTVLVYNERRHVLEEVHRASDMATASSDSVEFLLQEKPVQVPRAKVEHYMYVNRAFERVKSRYIEVPEEISKDTFMTLLELLHTDNYSPDIRAVCASDRKGPPVIKATHSDCPAYLLTDIRIFKLACEMGFDDIKGIALSRLYSQYTTHEDPVAVIEELYDGGEPDPDLREWGLKFLLREPDDDWMHVGSPLYELPNLVKLGQDLTFRERFYRLVPRFGALESDVRKAEATLLRERRMSPGPPVPSGIPRMPRAMPGLSASLISPANNPFNLPPPLPIASPRPFVDRYDPYMERNWPGTGYGRVSPGFVDPLDDPGGWFLEEGVLRTWM